MKKKNCLRPFRPYGLLTLSGLPTLTGRLITAIQMLGATVPLIEGDEKPLGFGGGKKINTSNIRPDYIHFLSLIH